MTTPDPFAEPVTFPSGVRWAPTDYRPIDQTVYRIFAAKPEGKPKQ